MKKLLMVTVICVMLLVNAVPAYADSTYVVQPGDTLFLISLKFNVSMSSIMTANGIVNPNLIYVGQRLIIPGPGGTTTTAPAASQTYYVKAGDNLFRISLKFGVSMTDIMTASGIANPNWIYVGQRLVIPVAGSPVATPAPTPAATPGATPAPTATPSGSQTYTVRSGDTLWSIGRKFGVTVAALKAANGLVYDWIYVGQKLTIPGAGTGTTATATALPPATSGAIELGGQASSLGVSDKMKNAGMTWVKQQVKWSPGAAASASAINDAHGKGLKILLSVVGNPADISGGANFDAYAVYVGQLAQLGADAIEVWNEMNLDREWPAGQINPTTYTDLLRRAYTQIKAKNPNTLVISGAPAPTGAEGAFGLDHVWNDSRYIAGMASAGAANYADCIGIHYNEGIISPTKNSGDPRDNYYTRYYSGMVNTYYTAFGGAKKLCFTELGYLSPEGYGPLPSSFGWAGNTTVAQQAQWLGEAVTLSRTGGKVRLLIVFNVDYTTYDADPQAGYAIIRPGGACPACETLRVSMQ